MPRKAKPKRDLFLVIAIQRENLRRKNELKIRREQVLKERVAPIAKIFASAFKKRLYNGSTVSRL